MRPQAKGLSPRETEKEITSEVKPLVAAFKDLRSKVMEWRSRAEEWKCRDGRGKVDDLKLVKACERDSAKRKTQKERRNNEVSLFVFTESSVS